MAKRRSALGFYTTEQRLVPAWEIAEVLREGSSVRLELRGGSRHRDFFQFWANDASTAGTIVRLLPTTRTVEYEGQIALPARETLSRAQGWSAFGLRLQPRNRVPLALAVALVGLVAILGIPKLRGHLMLGTLARPVASTTLIPPGTAPPSAALAPSAAVAPRQATDLEVINARTELSRYDTQIDGLRSQFRTAFTALQYGDLTRDEFMDGVNRWLIPQWRGLYRTLSAEVRSESPLVSDVRKQLSVTALGWDVALREYVRGLQEQNSAVVLGAIEQMSAANEEQARAWLLLARPE